jgi:hypothetical protein
MALLDVFVTRESSVVDPGVKQRRTFDQTGLVTFALLPEVV